MLRVCLAVLMDCGAFLPVASMTPALGLASIGPGGGGAEAADAVGENVAAPTAAAPAVEPVVVEIGRPATDVIEPATNCAEASTEPLKALTGECVEPLTEAVATGAAPLAASVLVLVAVVPWVGGNAPPVGAPGADVPGELAPIGSAPGRFPGIGGGTAEESSDASSCAEPGSTATPAVVLMLHATLDVAASRTWGGDHWAIPPGTTPPVLVPPG